MMCFIHEDVDPHVDQQFPIDMVHFDCGEFHRFHRNCNVEEDTAGVSKHRLNAI